MNRGMSDPEPETETISQEETEQPSRDIRKTSTEVEKIGDRIVKVQFIEYVGKRKKKVTHIEVKEAELDDMIRNSQGAVKAQYSLF